MMEVTETGSNMHNKYLFHFVALKIVWKMRVLRILSHMDSIDSKCLLTNLANINKSIMYYDLVTLLSARD